MSEFFLPSRILIKLFLLLGGDFEMQTEELAIRYRKYRNALKVLTLVLIISAGFGIFYWQVTAAKAEVVETWGMADAKEININSKVSGRVVKLFVEEGDRVTQAGGSSKFGGAVFATSTDNHLVTKLGRNFERELAGGAGARGSSSNRIELGGDGRGSLSRTFEG